MSARLEIPPLPDTTILLVEVGSTAHGTGIPGGEDHDEIGVVVETPAQLVGLDLDGFRTVMQRTQPEGARSGPGDVDRTLHSLRRFLRLAASGNPSILMVFWSPVELATDEGRELCALGDAFVARHVVPRYRGYMQAQAQRLLGVRGGGHGVRGGGRREELVAAHGYDTKYAMHAARLGFQGIELLTTGRLNLPIQGEPADWLRAVRRGDVSFEDWWARCLDLDAQLAALADDESIPPRADRARIDAWSIDVHQRFWDRPERVEVLRDPTGYGEFFTPEIGGLIGELTKLGYWDNQVAGLWLQGRVTEVYRLRAQESPEEQERLAFFAGVLRRELDRVRSGGSF